MAFVESCRRNSCFSADTRVHEGDRLVTFSTCTSGGDDKRFILVGVLRENVPVDASVNDSVNGSVNGSVDTP